jgi:RimJ/RimL family protein N-acetyltransferase
VEIGYAIAEAHQGRGLATEAVRAMAEWGTKGRGLPRVLAIVARDNVASCRVLEKAGFDLLEEVTRPLHGVTRRVRTYRGGWLTAGSGSRQPSGAPLPPG